MAKSSTSFTSATGKTRTSVGPGNALAVKHGARSPRLVRLSVQVSGRRLRRELEQRSEAPLQRLAIELEARLSRLAAYLDANGGSLVTRRGRQRGCATLYLDLSGRLLAVYDRLGVGRQLQRGQIASTEGLAGQLARRREELELEQGQHDGS